MRKTSYKKQPKLQTNLLYTGDEETKKLLRQLSDTQGLGVALQDDKGRPVTVRVRGDAIEKLVGGKWTSLSSSTTSVAQKSSSRGLALRNDGSKTIVTTSDHGTLTGLSDDDHSQYSLADGTRAFSGTVGGITPAADSDLATKGYVDGALHDAVTVADSDTVDLTLTGQQIEADVHTQMSIASDASGLKLDGDSASPGNSKLYGTNGSGTKGWYEQSAGGAGSSTTTTNFNKRLSSADDTIQKALDTLDDYQSFKLSRLNPQWLMEETFDRLIKGTLDSGNDTPASVTRNFGNSTTTDNNGIADWSGSWSSAAGYMRTYDAGAYMQVTIRTSGTNDIILNRGTSWPDYYDTAVAVTLDGASKTPWNQENDQTYTLSGVTAGVHVICITAVDALSDDDIAMVIKSIQYYQLPYQGVGVSGDVSQIIKMPEFYIISSISVGPMNNGANAPKAFTGESVIHRLPLGTSYLDKDFTRSSCLVSGLTYSWCANGYVRFPRGAGIASGFVQGQRNIEDNIRTGLSITLSSTAGTRGRQFTCSELVYDWLPNNASSIVKLLVMPFLAKITTAGSGSVFSEGDIVLLVVTCSLTNSVNPCSLYTGIYAPMAADVFEIPDALL